MADIISPANTVTFTITAAPRRVAEHKTLHRLIRMQREFQDGLRRISKRRRQHDNWKVQRAGRMWTNRVRMSRLSKVEKGVTFTLRLTPQIIPDIKSVEKFLKAELAK